MATAPPIQFRLLCQQACRGTHTTLPRPYSPHPTHASIPRVSASRSQSKLILLRGGAWASCAESVALGARVRAELSHRRMAEERHLALAKLHAFIHALQSGRLNSFTHAFVQPPQPGAARVTAPLFWVTVVQKQLFLQVHLDPATP